MKKFCIDGLKLYKILKLTVLNLRLIGVEPITFGTEIQRSIQLSYKRIYKKLKTGFFLRFI